ncbi:PREDICTED: uncharacterized protein LOC106307209 isoform X2 [Brassica oleracea var. oleracea]|uniref:uncharacterized protein LOC106307209 isoform X2 n=1 Tax=Brassica oleracea var. oleracea TaxID=109376 RepID=UPI0006A6F36A|nr:PREDICTED: uncharacterized protein LOC106307209 isoform X2 [Brassica oleracea var. oleracea]
MCCCGGTRRSWCVGVTVGTEVNRGLMFLQDLACRGSLKQFLMAAIGLWLAAMIGSCCNFLTVLYIGFVGAGGVFVCIFLWRIMFGIASTFVGLSEGMAKYGFLVLSSAIVAFAIVFKVIETYANNILTRKGRKKFRTLMQIWLKFSWLCVGNHKS